MDAGKGPYGRCLLVADGTFIAGYHTEGNGIRILDAVGAKEVATAAADLFTGGALDRLALSEISVFACSRTNL